MERFGHGFKFFMETISLTTIIATLTTILPPIAALVSIAWYLLNIYEKVTGKKIADRRKTPRT
jgi:hypothetical protein